MNSAEGTSRTAQEADRSAALEIEQRLSGDLAALSDFAQELALLSGPQPDDQQSAAGRAGLPGRINADEATLEQGLAKLVLTLIELLRRLLEKQALRRVEAGSLTDEQIERMGETFLKLDQKMAELKAAFGLEHEDLNLSLGPLRNLLPDD